MLKDSIAVFCGSKPGNHPAYAAAAAALGSKIGNDQKVLIYGGGKLGLMGVIANAAMEAGARVIGVIPEVLVNWEAAHSGISELRIVADMHTRKKMIYDLCTSAVILPGGFGTLDELFEMLTWNTLQIHSKKIIILNIHGFYNALVVHIKKMQEEGFLHLNWEENIVVVQSVDEIIWS